MPKITQLLQDVELKLQLLQQQNLQQYDNYLANVKEKLPRVQRSFHQSIRVALVERAHIITQGWVSEK